jgi:hypothetical protein
VPKAHVIPDQPGFQAEGNAVEKDTISIIEEA